MSNIRKLLAMEPLLANEAALIDRFIAALRTISEITDKMSAQRFGLKLSHETFTLISEAVDSIPDEFHIANTPRDVEEYLKFKEVGQLEKFLEDIRKYSNLLRVVASISPSKKRGAVLSLKIFAPKDWWDGFKEKKLTSLDFMIRRWAEVLTPFIKTELRTSQDFENFLYEYNNGLDKKAFKCLVGEMKTMEIEQIDEGPDYDDMEEGAYKKHIKKMMAGVAAIPVPEVRDRPRRVRMPRVDGNLEAAAIRIDAVDEGEANRARLMHALVNNQELQPVIIDLERNVNVAEQRIAGINREQLLNAIDRDLNGINNV
jgi:hypothetical protein